MRSWPHPIRVRITEVGPRDGLQNEPRPISAVAKIRFIDALSDAGCPEIEVSSFVSPRWVPQLADAAEVFAGIRRRPGCVYSALVPNREGLDRALAAGAQKIAVFTSASETFSRRNTNATIDESLVRIRQVADGAHAAGLPLRGYVSCVIRCPYEGPISGSSVRRVVESLQSTGVHEIDLGDTIGAAVPDDLDRLFDALEGVLAPSDATLHLHDTKRTALACAYRGLQIGVTHFDASAGGLGGCPFAPGARGNLATEELCYMLSGCGIESGIDASAVHDAAASVKRLLADSPRA